MKYEKAVRYIAYRTALYRLCLVKVNYAARPMSGRTIASCKAPTYTRQVYVEEDNSIASRLAGGSPAYFLLSQTSISPSPRLAQA